MRDNVKIPFLGTSFWEDLAKCKKFILAMLVTYICYSESYGYGRIEGLLAFISAIFFIVHLFRIVRRRRCYKDATMYFSNYPPQIGKILKCTIVFNEEFYFKYPGLAEIHRSGLYEAGIDDPIPLWACGAKIKHQVDEGKTVLSFAFAISDTFNTTYYKRSLWRSKKQKWELHLPLKRTDGIMFPHRRFIEVAH